MLYLKGNRGLLMIWRFVESDIVGVMFLLGFRSVIFLQPPFCLYCIIWKDLCLHTWHRHMHCKLRKFFSLLHSHVCSVGIRRHSIGSTSSHEKRAVRICYEPCCFYWCWATRAHWRHMLKTSMVSWHPSRSPSFIHPLKKNKKTQKICGQNMLVVGGGYFI